MIKSIITTIVVLGLAAWVLSLLPIPQPYARIIQVILIIAAVLYLLQFLHL